MANTEDLTEIVELAQWVKTNGGAIQMRHEWMITMVLEALNTIKSDIVLEA